MQITVTFRHIEPSDGLRQYAEKRLRRLSRVVGDRAEARVIMTVEKSRHRAEVSLSAGNIAVVGAEETEDMYAAIDLVVDKLGRKIREMRERRREPRRSDEA